MEGGLAGASNINWPKSPVSGLVVTNKMTLKNPLSLKVASVAKVAAAGTWCWRGTHQVMYRTVVNGRIRMQ